MIQKLFLISLSLCSACAFSSTEKTNFTKKTIDLGLVVSDLKRSLSFYKDVIGFKEKNGFEVAGSFPEKVGLTDGTPLKIHVLVLGDGENATNLKLMQVSSKKKARVIEQPFIHTLTGFSYITVFADNVDTVLKNAKTLGYKAYAESPQILPKGFPQDLCLLMLKDPDGNFVEIIGPATKSLK